MKNIYTAKHHHRLINPKTRHFHCGNVGSRIRE